MIVLAITKIPAIKTIKKRKNFSFEVPVKRNEKKIMKNSKSNIKQVTLFSYSDRKNRAETCKLTK